MKLIIGIVLSLITLVYWTAFLKNIPHMWKVVHSKEWIDVQTKSIVIGRLKVLIILILIGTFGLFLIWWAMQLLGIINS
jgi:hypothetical protein